MRQFLAEPFPQRNGISITFRPEIVPCNPRNPQPQSNTGQAKDHRARGNTMHIISSIRAFLFGLVMLSLSAASFAQLSISISFAPPELPVYEQPLCPGDGYLWTPGYWAYANDFDDYYWVPGTWVMAPEVGLLWTPAYWGWGGNGYVFYDGYWGPQVGFYGGISYGYGYFGEGYQGGRWQGGQFYYNRSVSNVSVTNIHNVYNTTVVNSTTVNRVSYNGGNGGITARPTPQDEAFAHQKHIAPVAAQTQHAQAARANPELRASVNHGTPTIAATPKPGALNDRAVVPAKQAGTPYNPPAKHAAVQPVANTPAVHPQNNTSHPNEPAPNNRPEPNRVPTAQPPTAQPEPNREEPAQRPQIPPTKERLQPERATPPPAPAETPHVAPEAQRTQPAARLPEVQNRQQSEPPKKEEPKKDEKPPK
jgi:hypothetical protein